MEARSSWLLLANITSICSNPEIHHSTRTWGTSDPLQTHHGRGRGSHPLRHRCHGDSLTAQFCPPSASLFWYPPYTIKVVRNMSDKVAAFIPASSRISCFGTFLRTSHTFGRIPEQLLYCNDKSYTSAIATA